MKRQFCTSVLLGVVFLVAAAMAQDTPPSETIATKDLSAVIHDIEGDGRVKRAGADDWIDAKPGMTIAAGDEIFTGFRSQMKIAFQDGDYVSSLVTVQPLTACSLAQFARDQEGIKTRLFLKQGTVSAGVTKGEIKTDMQIHTPQAVAAVTGTQIARMSQHPDTGFSMRMGHEGMLNLGDPNNFHSKGLGAGDQGSDSFRPAVNEKRLDALFDTLPSGYTQKEALSAMQSNARMAVLPAERASARGAADPDGLRRRHQGRAFLPDPRTGRGWSQQDTGYPYSHDYPPY